MPGVGVCEGGYIIGRVLIYPGWASQRAAKMESWSYGAAGALTCPYANSAQGG